MVWDALTISHRADPRRMLDAFVRIEAADAVLRFARRYGPLLLCSGGELLGRDHRGEECALEVGPPWDRGVERIEHWMQWVDEARAIMRIKAALELKLPGDESDWENIVTLGPLLSLMRGPGMGLPAPYPLWHEFAPPPAKSLAHQPLDKQLDTLWWVVRHWLERGDIRPVFGSTDSGATVTLLAGTFGSLALRLFYALSGSTSTAICDGCGTPYFPERKPRADRMRFCPVCRQNGTAAKIQKRAQRGE